MISHLRWVFLKVKIFAVNSLAFLYVVEVVFPIGIVWAALALMVRNLC